MESTGLISAQDLETPELTELASVTLQVFVLTLVITISPFVGTIEVLTDPVVKKEMWYGGLVNHFNGPEDPNYCVLHFKTERYNLLVDWKEVRGTM